MRLLLLLGVLSPGAAAAGTERPTACAPAAEPAASSADLPAGFVDVAAHVPGIVVELRYATSRNFVGRPIDGYESPRAILSQPAARALRAVQAELARVGLGLKLFDAYRPQRAVLHFIRWTREPAPSPTEPTHHPGLRRRDLFAQGYLNLQSSHSRGSAVDVTLVRRPAGGVPEELDLGTPFDFFGPAAAFAHAGLTAEQRRHRDRLRQVMEAQGFVGSDLEWWHFRLRDEPYPETYYDFPVR